MLSAFESILLKTPANYQYQEEIAKTVFATAAERKCQQDHIFLLVNRWDKL